MKEQTDAIKNISVLKDNAGNTYTIRKAKCDGTPQEKADFVAGFELLREDFDESELEGIEASMDANKNIEKTGYGERTIYITLDQKGEVVCSQLLALFTDDKGRKGEANMAWLENISVRKDMRRKGIAENSIGAAQKIMSQKVGKGVPFLVEAANPGLCREQGHEQEHIDEATQIGAFYDSFAKNPNSFVAASEIAQGKYVQAGLIDENGEIGEECHYMKLRIIMPKSQQGIDSRRIVSALRYLNEDSYMVEQERSDKLVGDFIKSLNGTRTVTVVNSQTQNREVGREM